MTTNSCTLPIHKSHLARLGHLVGQHANFMSALLGFYCLSLPMATNSLPYALMLADKLAV
jgi:hypothetical protein